MARRHKVAHGAAALANDLCGRRKRRLEAPNHGNRAKKHVEPHRMVGWHNAFDTIIEYAICKLPAPVFAEARWREHEKRASASAYEACHGEALAETEVRCRSH